MASKFKVPKNLAQCADLLYTIQHERYAIQKKVDALKASETLLTEKLINELPKSSASGIAGKVARATIKVTRLPQATDWLKVFKHIEKTGDFDLLQRRLSNSAVEERWQAKKQIPGIEAFNVVKVSLNKV